MRFEQLECFVEAAKNSSMSAASQKLHVSPQNVSKAIGQLEDELNATLFIRSSRKIHLTTAGQEAYDMAAEILTRVSQFKAHFQAKQSPSLSGPLNISTSITMSFFIASQISDLIMQHPQLSIRMTDREQLSANKLLLDEDDYDITFFSSDNDTLHSIFTQQSLPAMKAKYQLYFLQEEMLRLFMSKSAPLATQKTISVEHLRNAALIVYCPDGAQTPLVGHALETLGIHFNQLFKTSNYVLSLRHLKTGRFYALSSPLVYDFLLTSGQEQIISRPLAEKIPWTTLMLAKKGRRLTPQAQAIIDLIFAYFGDSVRQIF